MGFDYGYSLADPNMLVCWEGQFGDFCNGAEIIIDQYIASAEVKWGRWSGLVLLLPHGYEHAGPEHSSARLERFLALCGDENMQVVYPTTGAQIFHLLRRQVRRNFRKPLIVMTPKGTLRTPTSTIDELTTGSFLEMLDDPAFATGKLDRKGVKKILLTSGKFYYELADRRDKLARKDVAIIRLEQLYPFHHELLAKLLAAYPKSAELVYAQEEPRNAGAYLFVADAMRTSMGISDLAYVGRDASASPAVGSKHVSKTQQESVLTRAIGPLPESKESKPSAGKPTKVGA
jgi:2-oxoglutarate dehydrogenase E1 component